MTGWSNERWRERAVPDPAGKGSTLERLRHSLDLLNHFAGLPT